LQVNFQGYRVIKDHREEFRAIQLDPMEYSEVMSNVECDVLRISLVMSNIRSIANFDVFDDFTDGCSPK